MKHKTWFRLALKVLGVWLTVSATSTFVAILANIILMAKLNSAPRGYPYWVGILSPIVEAAVGLYLFFGGKWIVDMAIPSNRPYCHECGYDLTGAVGHVCNECGTAFRSEVA